MDELFTDHQSGGTRAGRPGLTSALRYARRGDTLADPASSRRPAGPFPPQRWEGANAFVPQPCVSAGFGATAVRSAVTAALGEGVPLLDRALAAFGAPGAGVSRGVAGGCRGSPEGRWTTATQSGS